MEKRTAFAVMREVRARDEIHEAATYKGVVDAQNETEADM